MADLGVEGERISDLDTVTISSFSDWSKVTFAIDDENQDPVSCDNITLDDLLSASTVSGITWHATDRPATNATKGLYGVYTGTYRGLYVCTGTNRYVITLFEEDGA